MPPARGVFESDPNHPPIPPTGASAIEVRDQTGRVVGYAWLSAEYDINELDGAAWAWLDRHEPPSSPSGVVPCRLLR